MYKQVSLLVLCAVMACHLTHAAQQVPKWAKYTAQDPGVSGGFGYYEYLPDSYNNATADRHPVIFFMHGLSERGNGQSQLHTVLNNGIPTIIKNGQWPASFPFIVFSPQECCWWDTKGVKPKLKWLLRNYPKADRTRVYLTGLSLGGGGAWVYPGGDYSAAMEIAAIVPVCGQSNPTNPENVNAIANMKQANLPVWAFHNSKDDAVDTSNTEAWINQLNAAPGIVPTAKMTIYPVSRPTHNAWDKTYDPSPSNQNNIYAWMLNYSRPNAYSPTSAPTSPPTAAPTAVPTAAPTAAPTVAPTAGPTSAPTAAPTVAPTAEPTVAPVSCSQSAVGTGTGLRGDYYSGTNFNTFRTCLVDPTVDYAWGTTGPSFPNAPTQQYTVRWTGQVQSRYTVRTRFFAKSASGARLWIDGDLIFNDWADHTVRESSGTYDLVAGQKYNVTLEYKENTGPSTIQFSWRSDCFTQRVIPSTQLYPVAC